MYVTGTSSSSHETPTNPPIKIPRGGLTVHSLSTKLIIAFLLVALIPLGLLAFLNDRTTRAALKDNANRALLLAAQQTATGIDTFIETTVNTVETEAKLPIFNNYLRLPAEQRPESTLEEGALAVLQELSNKDPIFITSYALLDEQGVVVLDTNPDNIGLNQTGFDYFTEPFETGQPFVSGVHVVEPVNNAGLYFSSPVHDAAGNVSGILTVRYRADILQALIIKNNDLFGQESFAVLLDEHHIRLAHGVQPDLIFKSVVPLEPDLVAELQAEGRLSSGSATDLATNLTGFENGLNRSAVQPYFTAELTTMSDRLNSVAVTRLKRLPWSVVFAQPQEIFLSPIWAQTRTTLVLAFMMAAIVIVAAFAMGQLMAGPIVRLKAVAAKVSDGDLTVQAEVESEDEIGALAKTFNSMTAQLHKLVTNLEQQVQERTGKLTKANEQLLREIVEHERTEEALQRQRAFLHQVINSISHHVYMTEFTADGEQIHRYLSPNIETLTGHPVEMFTADWRFWQSLIHPDDCDVVTARAAHFTQGENSEVEYRLIQANGNIIWVRDSGRVEVDPDQQNYTVYGVVSNITERKEAEDALASAHEQALQASQLKSQLLANVSHDLRTPLNAVLGYAEMLQEGVYDPLTTQQRDITKKIIASAANLTDLVNELLDQAQLEAGTLKLVSTTFAPADLIDHVRTTMGVLAENKGLQLTSQIDSKLPGTICGDYNRLQQILLNLVGNAIKFTDQGQVHLGIYLPDPNHWEVRVTDTGPGISTEAEDYIFDAFRQVDATETRTHGGAGLGLSIVKQLVTLMGGRVSLESEIAQGSTFIVNLPLSLIPETA